MAELEDNKLDPFSPEGAPVVSLIVQMRIYDVLLALLTDAAPEAAAKLHELHSQGKLLGSFPSLQVDSGPTGPQVNEEENA